MSGWAGPKSDADVVFACMVSCLACFASRTPGWFSAIGCLERASAGMASPLMCNSSMSISFILIRNACMVLSSRLPFFTIGK